MSSKNKTKAKILIIDDQPDLLEIFTDMLQEEGYAVITACDGLEGIKKNTESKPNLIILDLKMSKMDGLETLRNIRKTDKGVIVIILTGYGSAGSVRDAVDLNVYEYISKPFKNDVLINIINEALASPDKKNKKEAFASRGEKKNA